VTETKVPFLGDIPLLGQAFKHKGQSKSRTELIVFIRPTVLRTEEQATAEAVRRVRLLKAGEELELEKRFQAETPMAVETNSSSKATEPNTAPVAEMTEQQRHAAKVKSLSEIK
jgi:general secretion pathway protein D